MNDPALFERAEKAGLKVDIVDGIGRLVLDRGKGNRFSHALIAQWAEVARALSDLPDLRVVVLTAEGPDFSFGADLTDSETANRVAGGHEARQAFAALGQQALDAWAALPVPTLAAGKGRIIGAGACFFCTADFGFAPSDAVVQFPEVDRGMHLSWGVIPRLVARYGLPHAMNLAMLGEPVACVDLPQPPLHIEGDPVARAEDLARKLSRKPPLAVRAIKRTLTETASLLQAAAARDAQSFADTVGSADFAEAMAAWFEKRPPQFTGR